MPTDKKLQSYKDKILREFEKEFKDKLSSHCFAMTTEYIGRLTERAYLKGFKCCKAMKVKKINDLTLEL